MSPVKILFASGTSWRRLQDMSSRFLQDMSSRPLEDVFSVTIFRLPRRLQYVLENVRLLRWRRAEDVLKTNKCLLGMFFSLSKYSNFCIPHSSTFFPCIHCLRIWSKINLKVYDVMSWPNKSVTTCAVWYLGKKVWYWNFVNLEDRVSNKKHFYWKGMQKSPRLVLSFGK